MSDMPLFDELEKILKSIYNMAIVKGISYPYDSYLEYLTFQASMPAMQTEVVYSLADGNSFSLLTANENQFENITESYYFDFFIKNHIDPENLMHVIYWIMCQVGSTVIVSNSYK